MFCNPTCKDTAFRPLCMLVVRLGGERSRKSVGHNLVHEKIY